MYTDKIIIAIDGYSSCGKSTLAKALARELNYVFIDTGAMYRAVTYFALKNKLIDSNGIQHDKLIRALPKMEVDFKLNRITKSPELFLNGKNIDDDIRKPEIANCVSQIAAIPEVRHKMVAEQQKMGKNGGVVMDGRDIGSVVFPNAAVKFFVTAAIETRANRRFLEMKEKGIEISLDEVKANLESRDLIDTTRSEGPLIQTEDAIVIDNTNLTRESQLQLALDHVHNIISQN